MTGYSPIIDDPMSECKEKGPAQCEGQTRTTNTSPKGSAAFFGPDAWARPCPYYPI